MKKKIAILGSTGSIGKNTIDILKKNKDNFQVLLLSTNTNVKTLIKQAIEFKVKHLIIIDRAKFLYAKHKYKKFKFKIHNNFECFNHILKQKEIYYSMISLVGIDGLKPTLKIIKFSQNIAIANKESLICGWSLIQKSLNYYKTNFIPIDSEHFSINNLITDTNVKNINKIFLTASGGPFLKYKKINSNSNLSLENALLHPNWTMGKKISIDSATLMNKVFEVIEAKNIFNIPYDKINIITHPKSYIHSFVEFNNGLIKFLAHDPTMKIPIYNSITNNDCFFKSKPINFKILNNLNLKKINNRQFPLIKILKFLPHYSSLYEVAIVVINDFFVHLFLKKKINYFHLIKYIKFFVFNKEILHLREKKVKSVDQILTTRQHLSLKLDYFVYKSLLS